MSGRLPSARLSSRASRVVGSIASFISRLTPMYMVFTGNGIDVPTRRVIVVLPEPSEPTSATVNTDSARYPTTGSMARNSSGIGAGNGWYTA